LVLKSKDTHGNLRHKGGFTLLEMVMILVLIGITAMTMVPNLTDLINDWQIKQIAYQLKGDVLGAQQMAISESLSKMIIYPEFDGPEENKAYYKICDGEYNCVTERETVILPDYIEVRAGGMKYMSFTEYGDASGCLRVKVLNTQTGASQCLRLHDFGNIELETEDQCVGL